MEKEERQDHGVDGALGGLNPTCIKVGEAQDLWGGGCGGVRMGRTQNS